MVKKPGIKTPGKAKKTPRNGKVVKNVPGNDIVVFGDIVAEQAKAPDNAKDVTPTKPINIPVEPENKPLNPRQRLFVLEYCGDADANATQAAIRAGYSKNGANVTASQLLAKPNIKQAVADKMLERTTKLDISIDRVLTEAARMAFSDVRNLFDSNGFLLKVTDLDDDTAAAIQSIEVTTRALGHSVPGEGEQPEPIVELTSKIKLVEKRASVEMLMRHLGLFEKDNMQQEADIASVELIFRDGRETANG